MKWKILAILLLIIILTLVPQFAYADTLSDLENEVQDNLGEIDFSNVDSIANGHIGSVAEKVLAIINGEFDSAETFFNLVLALFSDGLKSVLPKLVAMFAIIVILGLIRRSSGSMISESTNEVVNFVGVTAVLLTALALVVSSYRQIYQLLSEISVLTETSMPILLTLLIANGGNVTSAVCQPSMVMFSTVVIKTIQTVVLPLSLFSVVFSIVGNISSNIKVNKMSGFLSSTCNWVLGCLFMVYSAFTSVQGISAASIDGVSYRAAKFATKSYIPILGGYLADGFDVVVASTSLIKNAFGVVVLLVLVFMLAEPLMSVVSVNLGLQCVAAVCEPVADERYIKILNGISKTLTFMSVLVIAVAFMFSILMLITINCANGV